MSTFLKVLIVILLVLIVALVVLYFVGRRLQKKQEASQEQMEAAKQTVTLMAIDKKMLPLNKSGLPQIVIDQTPKLMRRSKLPIVKARVQGRIVTMIADSKVFDIIPLNREVKAIISGIYIMNVKAIRGTLEAPPKKEKFLTRAKNAVTSPFRKKEEPAPKTSKKKK